MPRGFVRSANTGEVTMARTSEEIFSKIAGGTPAGAITALKAHRKARIGLVDHRDAFRPRRGSAPHRRSASTRRLHIAPRRMPDVEHQRHAPRNHVGQRRRAAVVVDVVMWMRLLLQQFAGQ